MGYLSLAELERIGFKSLGRNVSISSKASIYGAERIEIGDHSRIDDFCILSAGSGGIAIGRYVHIAPFCGIAGDARIVLKDFSGLSARVYLYSSSDDYSGEWMANPTVPKELTNVTSKPVTLEKHALIGVNSVVLPGVTIGEGASCGAFSFIVRDCLPNMIYAGIPAKPIRSRAAKIFDLEKHLLNND